MIAFSPRAALCTFAVIAGFGAAIAMQYPGGPFGLIGTERDGLLAIERGGLPREQEQQDIIGAVLAYEARKVERGAVCVDLAEEGEALVSERLDITRLQRAVAAAAAGEARAELLANLDHRRNPMRAWLRSDPEALPLGDENARQLQSAETAILGMAATGRADVTLDMTSLPESLRSTVPGCPKLTFTAPAIVGEIAFVETRFAPPGLPQEAWLYAVVHGESGWRVEAMARQ